MHILHLLVIHCVRESVLVGKKSKAREHTVVFRVKKGAAVLSHSSY